MDGGADDAVVASSADDAAAAVDGDAALDDASGLVPAAAYKVRLVVARALESSGQRPPPPWDLSPATFVAAACGGAATGGWPPHRPASHASEIGSATDNRPRRCGE